MCAHCSNRGRAARVAIGGKVLENVIGQPNVLNEKAKTCGAIAIVFILRLPDQKATNLISEDCIDADSLIP